MTHLMDSCVELVEKERECLFALQGGAGKQVAIPQTELHLKIKQFQLWTSDEEFMNTYSALRMKVIYQYFSNNIHLYVNSVSLPPLDKRRPQPVVNIGIADIADNIAPPVDPLVEIGEALLNPAWKETSL